MPFWRNGFELVPRTRERFRVEAVPERWRGTNPAEGQIANGGSAIIGPDGSYVAGPSYDEETVLYGEVDLAKVALAKNQVDVAGHYSRPDVVRLLFDQSPHTPLVAAGEAPPTIEPLVDKAPAPRRAAGRRKKKR